MLRKPNREGNLASFSSFFFLIGEVASENLPTFAANLLGIFIQGVSRQVSKNSLKSGIGGRITKSFNVVIGKSLRFVLV